MATAPAHLVRKRSARLLRHLSGVPPRQLLGLTVVRRHRVIVPTPALGRATNNPAPPDRLSLDLGLSSPSSARMLTMDGMTGSGPATVYLLLDHDLPDRPPLAETDDYDSAMSELHRRHDQFRHQVAANGEGGAETMQTLAITATSPGRPPELRYMSVVNGVLIGG